jgi:hypothetical protein
MWKEVEHKEDLYCEGAWQAKLGAQANETAAQAMLVE